MEKTLDHLKHSLLIPLILMATFAARMEAQSQELTMNGIKYSQKEIIEKYVTNCSDKLPVNTSEYQICLDTGLAQDSTVAYLWQQKAMPYFKAMKYEVGMEFLDRAVQYDRRKWLPYRAFIKCIFAKTYHQAIKDFESSIAEYGNNYEMDHTYKFYIGLAYLQLNEFEMAEKIFEEDIKAQTDHDEPHHLDLFYFGIAKYEQGKWEEAIVEFDKALDLYPQFSDVQYYKGVSLARLGYTEKADALFKESERNRKAGYTINEGNSVYERYPYQIR